MGLSSHGVLRIPQYVRDVRAGTIAPGATIRIQRQNPTTALVDGGWKGVWRQVAQVAAELDLSLDL